MSGYYWTLRVTNRGELVECQPPVDASEEDTLRVAQAVAQLPQLLKVDDPATETIPVQHVNAWFTPPRAKP